MRLSDFEKDSIVETIVKYDPEAEIYLYGSRCDDEKKGGDIDLAILSKRIDRKRTGQIRMKLYELIGEQKIDIITAGSVETPFLKKAINTGIQLYGKSGSGDIAGESKEP